MAFIADRLSRIKPSPTNAAQGKFLEMKAAGKDVIGLAAGEPDFPTPDHIKEAAIKAIHANDTKYTAVPGTPALRQAICAKMKRDHGLDYKPSQTVVTSGGKQIIFNAMLATLNPGDEVIIPAPYWVTFPEQVRLAGATPVFLPTGKQDFQIDPDELARRITPRTRGLILNTPHNPTGAVYPAATLEKIARLALKHDLICIFDECYDELVYAPAAHSNMVKLVPEMKARTILIGSLSKTLCLKSSISPTCATCRNGRLPSGTIATTISSPMIHSPESPPAIRRMKHS